MSAVSEPTTQAVNDRETIQLREKCQCHDDGTRVVTYSKIFAEESRTHILVLD